MVASTTQTGPANGPPSAFDIVERYGTVALLKFVGALLAFAVIHVLLRLPLLMALRITEGLMTRVNDLVAAGFPGRPTTPAAYGGGTA